MNTKILKNFGDVLKKKRKQAGFSQEELSEKLGTTITIRDALKHGDAVKPADNFKTDRKNGFVSDNSNNKNENIDIYQNTTANINDMGNSNECIDLTDKDHVAGMLVAVKGLTASNYKDKLDKASDNDRYEFIAITVVQGRCTYALYSASATPGEVRAGMLK